MPKFAPVRLMHLMRRPSTVEIRYNDDIVHLPELPPEQLALAAMLEASWRDLCSSERPAPLRIRVLSPEVIMHGMNYFWRAASDRPKPSFVHANGVDEKIYFLRDRRLWFVDDWRKRFPSERFLQYDHPRGQDLAGDFKVLLAALELAKALKRRLVLPRTMRCSNSPAHAAYHLHLEDCTVDHFASAKILLRYYNESIVESSLPEDPRFKALMSWRLKRVDDVNDLLEDVRARSAPILILEVNVTDVRNRVLSSLQGSPGSLWKPPCKFAYWPGRQMACRDEAFLRSGKVACKPFDGQQACGIKGFSCCEVFHGWAEKLEIFTGRAWDLPCNCGVSVENDLPHHRRWTLRHSATAGGEA
ncbi:unnamed protein product [Durusdinium trenchii]|uniref:Uncharacterized protein n=1 Tax=Durusdinium trenchii TaxID=1381693 RepID=A0ABP0S3L1_9DINO